MEEVRPARAEDLGRCRELLAQAIAQGRGADLRPAHLEDPERLVLTGWFHGALVGLALARLEREGSQPLGILELCYVEEDARGVGVGGALVEAVAAWSADAGCSGTEARALPGDRATKRLLEAAGFKTRLLVLRRPAEPPHRPRPPGP